MDTFADSLRNCLQILRERGWIKGALKDSEGAYCAVGVILCEDPHTPGYFVESPTIVALGKAVRELFPERTPSSSYGNWDDIVQFNNNDDTVFEDIEVAFEKAAVKAEELV